MSEWFDNQDKQISNFYKLLQERIEKENPRRKLSAEETKRLNKLEAIADKLKRGENVQKTMRTKASSLMLKSFKIVVEDFSDHLILKVLL